MVLFYHEGVDKLQYMEITVGFFSQYVGDYSFSTQGGRGSRKKKTTPHLIVGEGGI